MFLRFYFGMSQGRRRTSARRAHAKGLVKICQIPPSVQMEPNHTCPPIISSKSSTLTIQPSPPKGDFSK